MKKQNLIIIFVIGFMLSFTIGYALFSDIIIIEGTATARGNFDIEFTSAEVSNEIGSTDATTKISDDKNTLNITVPMLEYPGAYSEITVIITNVGTIPAKLTGIDDSGIDVDPNILISYIGLEELKEVIINQNTTQSFKIKVMWDPNSTSKSENVEFSIKLNYQQA